MALIAIGEDPRKNASRFCPATQPHVNRCTKRCSKRFMQDCKWEQVNPKAITADELYGTIEKALWGALKRERLGELLSALRGSGRMAPCR